MAAAKTTRFGNSSVGRGVAKRGMPSTPTATDCARRRQAEHAATGAEIVERSFAHNLERGAMRRTWLRGRENVHKRYLIHVAGHNLGILMRLLIGAGTPKEAAARGWIGLLVTHGDHTLAIVIFALDEAGPRHLRRLRHCRPNIISTARQRAVMRTVSTARASRSAAPSTYCRLRNANFRALLLPWF
jgi:hypothetical protein